MMWQALSLVCTILPLASTITLGKIILIFVCVSFFVCVFEKGGENVCVRWKERERERDAYIITNMHTDVQNMYRP